VTAAIISLRKKALTIIDSVADWFVSCGDDWVTYIAAGVGSTCHHTNDEHTTDTGLHYPTIFPLHIDDIDAGVVVNIHEPVF